MKHAICLAITRFVLTACAAKTETFRFNSNANNVLVTVGEQSCYTPCELELELQEKIEATVSYDKEFGFYMKADNPYYYKKIHFGDITFFLFFGVLDGGLAVISSAPTFTSSLSTEIPIAATSTTAEEIKHATHVWRYDTRAYYIYLKPKHNNALHNTEYTDYVLTNFELMQQELFAIEQPLIDECIKRSGVSTVQNLLIESENAVIFLDKLTLEKVKQILDSDANRTEKITALSSLLWYDGTALEKLYTNNASFTDEIEQYLQHKRKRLRAIPQ